MKKIKYIHKEKKIKVYIAKTIVTSNSLEKVLIVKGPLGQIEHTFKMPDIESNIFVTTSDYNFLEKKIKHLIKSVTKGWYIELNLNGLGFKVFPAGNLATTIKGKYFCLDLGYSSLVVYKPTFSISLRIHKNKIILFGVNKKILKDVATQLRNYAFPDKYRHKGIIFDSDMIKIKTLIKN